jgi:hypothetical protein
MRLGQFRENPGPDGIKRDLRGGGILDHGNILHEPNLATDEFSCQGKNSFQTSIGQPTPRTKGPRQDHPEREHAPPVPAHDS